MTGEPGSATAVYLKVTLRPEPPPTPRVHVELRAAGKGLETLHLATGAPGDLTGLAAVDGRGHLDARAVADAGGITVTLGRPVQGELRVIYDVRAEADMRAATSSLVVADDRFYGTGERLVLLPMGLDNAKGEVTVAIDGAQIRAPNAASSLGLGASRTREAKGHALVRGVYLAGSMGVASFDDALDRDHATWLGYTVFDPRPAAAELAVLHTALRERFKGGEEELGLFLVSTPRPAGSYALVPRAGGVVLHLGPNEAWSPSLRVNLTQLLMHTWFGGELRLATAAAAHEAEVTWFYEGMSRYLGARLLEHMELLKAEDALDYTRGLLAVQATSAHRGRPNAEIARAVATDREARPYLVARGALYAQRLAAVVRARSKGARSLESAIVMPLLVAARDKPGVPLPERAFVEAVARELGLGEAQALDAFLQGREVVLPADALGPCFRSHAGEYVAFALGFDLSATLDSPSRVVVGIEPRGPAATGGLADGDVLEDAFYREGHADAPVDLTVSRKGAKVHVRYTPRGEKRKGQLWDRAREVPDAQCGPVL